MTQRAAPEESLFELLARDLPPKTVFGGKDISEQARATLHFIVDPIVQRPEQPEPVDEDPLTCPNCGRPADSPRSPYCGCECREVAAFVRQFRGGLMEGTVFDPERQVALGQKLWRLAGGGYPLRQSIAPASSLKQVLKRTAGLCEICGAPAETFDHTGSG